MPTATQTQEKSHVAELRDKTRLLLTLWSLGARENQVKKSDVSGKTKTSGEAFQQLEQDGAISIVKQGRSLMISLTSKGVLMLGESLNSDDFAFGSQIGAKTANALLSWFRQSATPVSETATNGKAAKATIASYEEFKQVALDVYDRLNRDYNLDNLVPIYRIRREIGNQVSRSQFNEWMLNLQANDVLQLIGGEMPSLTPDIAEDSIETKLGGVRYYVKQL